jgi:hypothetical protein
MLLANLTVVLQTAALYGGAVDVGLSAEAAGRECNLSDQMLAEVTDEASVQKMALDAEAERLVRGSGLRPANALEDSARAAEVEAQQRLEGEFGLLMILTTYYLLLTTYYVLFTIYYLLFTTYFELPLITTYY